MGNNLNQENRTSEKAETAQKMQAAQNNVDISREQSNVDQAQPVASVQRKEIQ